MEFSNFIFWFRNFKDKTNESKRKFITEIQKELEYILKTVEK